MRPPQWLAEKIAATGVLVLDGKMPRADADAVIAAATREHPEFGEQLAGAAAAGLFGRWLREHTSSGDLFQAQTFPGLPASLTIAPRRSAPVADMTARDLDNAKRMLYARTQNAIDGVTEAITRERTAFDDFYSRVRPLLTGKLTVSDVIGTLTTGSAA